MKHRIILFLIILSVLISAAVLIADILNSSAIKPDSVEISKIKTKVESANNFSDFSINSKYGFTVIDFSGAELFSTEKSTKMSFPERISNANTNYDTVADYEKNGEIIGKIIIYTGEVLAGSRTAKLIAVIIPFSVLCLLLFLYYLYMRVYLYRPFKKLQNFAVNIAAGDLNLPLPMDKDNLFGEFSESFDLMREELKAAKKKAVFEEKSKKELIVTLSHDIKTPVSVVRAASALLEINETDSKKLGNIRIIKEKTFEIDRLITDLFSSALDDLSELKVTVRNFESKKIESLILDADNFKKVKFTNAVPECLVRADQLRLAQVFGNIISNSNKYAETDIEVSFKIIDDFLKTSFKDFGDSFDKTELVLIKNKFYRGKNAQDKQGAGLGLYICSKLIERMGGKLEINIENGFKVDVSLALS